MSKVFTPVRTLVTCAGALLVLLTAGVFAAVTHAHRDREIHALPEAERTALYERAQATLRTSCTNDPSSTLADYCRQQADFVRQLPECDQRCLAFTARFGSHPTR